MPLNVCAFFLLFSFPFCVFVVIIVCIFFLLLTLTTTVLVWAALCWYCCCAKIKTQNLICLLFTVVSSHWYWVRLSVQAQLNDNWFLFAGERRNMNRKMKKDLGKKKLIEKMYIWQWCPTIHLHIYLYLSKCCSS